MKPTEFELGSVYNNDKYGPYMVDAVNDGILRVTWPDGRGPATLDAEIQARMITRHAIEEQAGTINYASDSHRLSGASSGKHNIESWRLNDWRWWTTVGFIAKRFQSLSFLTPPEKLDALLDELAFITTVPADHKGIYITDSNKWSYSSEVMFKADQAEINWLRVFFAGFCEVSPEYANQDGTGGWAIHTNDVTKELLILGFYIGEGIAIKNIRLSVPDRFKDAFDRGLAGNLQR